MSIIPILTARALARVLIRAGFTFVRQKGSHMLFRHFGTGRQTVVPGHVGDLTRGTISDILKQAGISVQAFLRLLRK